MAAEGAKKQVRFARLEEEEGAREEAGALRDAVGEDAAAGESPPGSSAPLALQPVVKVADGSGRRSRAGGGLGAGKLAAAAAVAASRRALKWCISAALCAAFLGLGMAIAVLGPTFQDLAANVNKNVSQISYIFVGRSAGYFSGSLIGGILFDCMNSKLLLGGNVLALDTWQAEAGPHIQALHFSFALGAFVAPILAKMALGGSALELQIHLGSSVGNQSATNSPPGATLLPKLHLNWNFVWSYAVIGTYLLLVALFFFTLYLRSIPVRGRTKLSVQKYQIAKYHYALIVLLSVFFFWYVGAEVTYGSYIFTYAKTYAHMKEKEAAGLNSLFWGTFAACRGLAICFAACSYPGSMILISIIGSTVSSLFLVLFNVHTVTLWVGSAVYGASMATIFPSGISWIEQYTTIQGKSAAMFVMGAALGEMCIPAAVGFLQGYFPTLPVLMYTALGAAVMTAVLFPVMCKLAASAADAKVKDAGDREVQEALLSSTYPEDDEEDNEIREWNEVDFEIIEMNDTPRNSVIETSKKIQEEFTTTNSGQLPSENLSFNSSPVLAVRSPKQNKND
ncbi:sodium-dependent glucose transporter 1 isoform X2 [Thamnophis elegans]|uniref:sodium-dependent glucose transporter 1 isoform X2 n=1 Tax=Thamnophis elegans TaxID=35005 RepID=UPI001376E4F3|nr:sodium-dependent glucose transporter 1 isoform X2 [Thamnophis elegans]